MKISCAYIIGLLVFCIVNNQKKKIIEDNPIINLYVDL